MISGSLSSCTAITPVFKVSCSSFCTCVVGKSYCSTLSHPSKTPSLKCISRELSVRSQLCRDNRAESEYHCLAGLSTSRQHYLPKQYQKVIYPTLSNLYSTFLLVFDSNVI